MTLRPRELRRTLTRVSEGRVRTTESASENPAEDTDACAETTGKDKTVLLIHVRRGFTVIKSHAIVFI